MPSVPSAQHPPIAREGHRALLISAICSIGLYAVLGLAAALPGMAVFVLLLVYFRDPQRESPSMPLGVVAPLDGTVTQCGVVTDPWLGRQAVAVGVSGGPADVHSLFSPLEGKIVEQWRTPAFAEQAARNTVAYHIRTDEGDDLVLAIERPRLGGSVSINYQPGERVGHGRRIGYAPLGCTMTVYADAGANVDAGMGEYVRAASTIIISLVHETPVSAVPEEIPQAVAE